MTNRGYVALMTVIIVSFVLLAFIAEESVSGMGMRSLLLAEESKQESAALAKECLQVALLRARTDPFYKGNATTTAPDGICVVGLFETLANGGTVLTVKGISAHAYTALRSTLDSGFQEVSRTEVP